MTRLRVAEAIGPADALSLGATIADSVYTRLDGPREPGDVMDVTRIWVTGLGSPRRVIDAMGGVTAVERGGRNTSSRRWAVTKTETRNDDGDAVGFQYSRTFDVLAALARAR